ncbi:MAG: hypothetical protein HOP06_02690 [Methylotenera sp.]|nr:hypothetical protein [Methylotenera sp.]
MKLRVQSAPSQIKTLGFIAAAMLLSVSQSVWALGTASGTDINNLAKLSFSVGGVAQNEVCSSSLAAGNSLPNGGTTGTTCTSGTNGALNTTFKVDNKVNLAVTEVSTTATSVVPGQQDAVTTFLVTNNGNTTQDYILTGGNVVGAPTVLGTADNFEAAACSTFVESNAVADGYQLATDTATFINDLAANGAKTVYVVCDIPIAQVNGDHAVIELTAQTADTTGAPGPVTANGGANTQAGVEVVWADPATTLNGTGTDPGQFATDGKGLARDAYHVDSAVLSVSKVVTPICDPINGSTAPKNIPGAAVQYAVTIVNTGTAAASLTSLADTLDAALLFNADLISGAGAGAACVAGTGSLSASGFGAVSGAGAVTTYAAPGLAAQAVTAGATAAGQALTINYALPLAGAGIPGWTGSLAAGSFITVYFNAFIQ